MNKRTFEEAFNAVFHDKFKFAEFCALKLEDEIEKIEVDGRTIYRTSEKLKRFLRFIDKVVLRHLAKDDEVVHSFIKGKSTLTAVTAHASSKYFFLTDIENFYPNIETENVRNILLRDVSLVPISDIQDYVEIIVSMTTYDGSLPIGFATSPQLSNAFLFDFDRAVKKHCQERLLIYTRYADDIIISGMTFEDLSCLKDSIQNYLSTCASPNLNLKSSKTHITQTGNKVKILGLVVLPNGKITIDIKYKKNIESLLHFYINDRKRYDDLLTRLRGGEQSLFGLLHYARSIDPEYLTKLQRKYGAFVLRSLMEDKWSDQ